MVAFQPPLHTVFKYKEIQEENRLNQTHYVKNSERVANNPDKPKRKITAKQKLEEKNNRNQHDEEELARLEAEKARDDSEPRLFDLFPDLNFNDTFYALNFQLNDEEGFRLKALSNATKEGMANNNTCRIVSKNYIAREKETIIESEFEVDSNGNEIVPEREIVKVAEIQRAVYFQYRIDTVSEKACQDPKIIIGLCRGGDVEDDPYAFASYMELSKTAQVWAMNMNTGDKFGNKRWTGYYNLDKEPFPKYGYFTDGCVIGVSVDMDRGIVSFYKDGHDLGQAFVQPELKTGYLYPFIQTNCECEISVFHPCVYPAYRPPKPQSEISEYNKPMHENRVVNDTFEPLGNDSQTNPEGDQDIDPDQ